MSTSARRLTLWLVLAASGCSALAHARSFVLARRFEKPMSVFGQFGQGFGGSVATVGPNVLVGAPFEDTTELGAGAAYLFDAATGVLLHMFQSPRTTGGGEFGWSVAAVGPNVLVGARGDDSAAPLTGAVYLFDGATGVLLQTFVSPNPTLEGDFGFSVGALGRNVLVGAPCDGGVGAAYLFDGRTGEVLQIFRKVNPVPDDFFGWSVASVGGSVLVGAPRDDTAAPDAGALYLFDGATGAPLKTFLPPSPAPNDGLGDAVAALGSNALSSAGGVGYLFEGGSGAAGLDFQRPTSDTFDAFGGALAAVGSDVLVAARFDSAVASDAGAAYLFDGATGALLHTFRKPTPVVGDVFGTSIAALGPNVLVGVPGEDSDTVGPNAGAVYLFDDVSCGDGVLDRGEGCDGGSCSADCRLGDFICRRGSRRRGTAKFRPQKILLVKPSGMTIATTVMRPESLCAPAIEEGEGLRDFNAQLTCYEIHEPAGSESRQRHAAVSDRFGKLILAVHRPSILCVSSVRATTRSSVRLDTFACGRVQRESNSPTFRARDVVLVEGSDRTRATVTEPWTLCSPVDSDGEGVSDPMARLTCYRIARRGRRRPQSLQATLHDQFGDLNLALSRPRVLCVPSRQE